MAENLAERFGLPLWRFGNSGTEATMDAVHLMRAVTGRDLIIKVEGSYHGHHDSVMVSVLPETDDDIGPADAPDRRRRATPASRGAIMDLVTRRAVQRPRGRRARARRRYPGQVAGMILEPMMMNAGIIHPERGYLEGAARTSCTATARCSPSTR